MRAQIAARIHGHEISGQREGAESINKLNTIRESEGSTIAHVVDMLHQSISEEVPGRNYKIEVKQLDFSELENSSLNGKSTINFRFTSDRYSDQYSAYLRADGIFAVEVVSVTIH